MRLTGLGRRGPRKLTTQSDVANEVGYSLTIVSQVLRGDYGGRGIPVRTAWKIENAARALGYVYLPRKRRKDAKAGGGSK